MTSFLSSVTSYIYGGGEKPPEKDEDAVSAAAKLKEGEKLAGGEEVEESMLPTTPSTTTPEVTVADVRAQLSEEDNNKYKDYQIQRWLIHKRYRIPDVLKTINNQPINESRKTAILCDAERLDAVVDELNRGVLSVHPVPASEDRPKGTVVGWIDTHHRAKEFVWDKEFDAFIMFQYYLFDHLEYEFGEDATCACVIDMVDVATPGVWEIRQQVKMAGLTAGRSFPGMITEFILCNNWNALTRKAVQAIVQSVGGLPLSFASPEELRQMWPESCLPNTVGGLVDVAMKKPIGETIYEHFKGMPRQKRPPPPAEEQGDAGK
eukprot:TRINITY_DN94501_c0_g1_i1.p1 TRINITY_DN94501_c0_g1~~TRINITY_DN94501_c0_g1_i1.p1  ORF type:complete len:320 (+),score=38.11 TRINITY_DN94501_c0_g1_i1:108-1067(+)